ncbi:cupin [Brevibacillus sp. M2.1A]|uniref:cupin n=1 Tax=unclassified Brevibacillus TaxID=2684853 RepID=UPI00156B42D6|nr:MULTISPECIES: cupin [unclassified Brevibacillus]MCC8433935.1 cupin [Brevibacillus sp. M2.1A]MCE0451988.1 cupin [Brevibacillus sp. AF8]MCM3145472.1 cupin [Brevibacillus sp. MER 51]
MKRFRFDQQVGKTIDRYNSVHATISRVVRTPNSVSIGCIHLEAGGIVGYHPAPCPQLFLVVNGEGWVRGEGTERIPIQSGQAAFWITGEGHESGSETGMTAIVIEGDGLDPESFMSLLET